MAAGAARAGRRAGVELVPPPAEAELPAPDAPPTSWGKGRDLRTWSRGEPAWLQRRAELTAPASDRALRELLALQSSDWAFLIDAARRATTRASAFTATCARSSWKARLSCGISPRTWRAGRSCSRSGSRST